MLHKLTSFALILTVCLAVPAWAQDSVSNVAPTPGGPYDGDAFTPWEIPQGHGYVVDLAPLTTSWGYTFGVAPLAKSSKVYEEGYFNTLMSAQSISRLHAGDVPFALAEYAEWVAMPGYGVNYPTYNNTPNLVVPPAALGNQFAATFAEYGYLDSGETRSLSAIINAVVNYDPADPNRLYVNRVVAAVNSNDDTQMSSTFGIGAIDEYGNVMFRGDGNACTGPNTLLNNNIFHVSALDRNITVRNYIDNSGPVDTGATTWIVQHHAEVHNVPNIGPESMGWYDQQHVAYPGPLYIGSNFNSQYAYGTTSASYTSNHLGGASDHRGGVGYMTHDFSCFPSSATHGIGSVLAKDNAGVTRRIALWGLNDEGDVSGTLHLDMNPATISDPVTGMVPASFGANVFDHYHSQTAFSGGTSQVGMNLDQAGRLIAAGTVYTFSQNDDPCPWVAAARVTPGSCGAPEWTMVAYSCDEQGLQFSGKPILDGTGAQIGRMVGLDEVTGGSPAGPSISAPAVDAAGNVWFIAAVALDKIDEFGAPFIDYDSALLRAIYDPATFGYKLELVLEVGDVIDGVNSGLPYQISFLTLADSDSVASGTFWSSNLAETGYLGTTPGPDVEPADPTTMGGLVLAVDICYDSNGADGLYQPDGEFNDPTSGNYDPGYPADESYQVLLYIAPYMEGGCPDAQIISADPIDGAVDAREWDTDCEGIGDTFNPITICLDPAEAGLCDCFSLCETDVDATCGANSIATCTDLGGGCYEFVLAHGITAPAVTTIQYNGGDYVAYYHHPGNVDGSSVTNLTDINELINRLGMPGSVPAYEADIDNSHTINLTDLLKEIDLINGGWLGTSLPDPTGCPQ